MVDYGWYSLKDKFQKKEKNKRIAVVVTVCVINKMRRDYSIIDWELNPQEEFHEDKVASVKFMLKCHEKYDPGMEYDLIIIDHETTDEEVLDMITEVGMFRRENKGFSFGGYKWAYEKLREEYDYFLFHEQDCVPAKNGWLKEIYEMFHSSDKIGAVGNVVEIRDPKDPEDNQQGIRNQLKVIGEKMGHERGVLYNLDGTFTFTSTDILDETGLKVFDGGIDESTFNEILFVQPILEAGYAIASFGNREFKDTERIHFYGMRLGDLEGPFNETFLAPIVNGHTRLTCKQMKEYFNE